ncbi:unnamed protein product [Larinioides sclopetarius]|uniref:Uncharacterized protein n=1 Tax=Larinioides sclopetarius TaxID=280406 RepID=A0AAV2B2E5_9ARAC
MASKSKSKLKGHEIKCINFKRFAYDVIVYSAKKFGVSENCICIWEGPENDYGYPNFILVIFRLIVRHQIPHRHVMYKRFNSRYESNQLKSFKIIGILYQDVYKELTKAACNIFEEVQVTLSIACELILFLYAKNCGLYLKELAGYWYDCYFHLVTKKFKKEGGLDYLYARGKRPNSEPVDAFFDAFIAENCQSYEDSAKDENLADKFYNEGEEWEKKIEENLLKGCKDFPYVKRTTEYEIEVFVPLASKRGKDSTDDLPVNTGLGILPHEELLKKDFPLIAGATSPQNLPDESLQKPSRPRRGSSSLTKRRQRHTTSRSSVDQGLGQLSLDTSGAKQSSSVLVADNKASFQNLPSSSRQDLLRHHGGFSEEQESASSECTSMEENLGKLSLVFSRAEQLSKKPDASVGDHPAPGQNLGGNQNRPKSTDN